MIIKQSRHDFSGKHLCGGYCMDIMSCLCAEVKIQQKVIWLCKGSLRICFCVCVFLNFFLFTLFRVRFFCLQFTLQQLIQPDLEFRFIVTSQLGHSIQLGSSPSAGLQVATQSTHLSKDCYPQLVSNPHRPEIWPPKQLDYRCMPLHHNKFQKVITILFVVLGTKSSQLRLDVFIFDICPQLLKDFLTFTICNTKQK